MDRHSILDGNGTPTRENPNVFGDEFEVEDELYVADGFHREGGDRQDEGEPIRTAAAHVASSSSMSVTPAGPSRNSTRKSRGQQNPFASPEDAEAEVPLVRTPSGNFDVARRSVSSASSHQFARTSSQRYGAGPSHPYGMYPQGTMARTPSVATTSTMRPERQSSSRRPQHPYALYTQGVGDDSDGDQEGAPNPVPVGFLGIGEHYQRRRGPDGEEQDLLGDFGHTEQLPPYTRYPEDGPEKGPLLDVPIPPGQLHSRAPVLGTDPGMELMHAQLRPVPTQQSMTDQSELNRQSTVSLRRSLAPSAHTSSQEDSMDEQKAWREKSWREKRKTRVCGVPCLWYILLTGILVFIAAMLGGVIGGFVEGQKKGQAKALAAASKTLYDASQIVTATTTPPSVQGTYALPLGTPQATQSACLTIPGQQPAWDCNLAGDVDIEIVIDTPQGSDQPGAYLIVDVGNEKLLSYGSQRSMMSTTFSPFLLVMDNDAPGNGPAYYFQQYYNKMVVVPEDAIDVKAGKIKRDFPAVPTSWFNQKKFAGPNDKPWFCYWNQTFIEGFIYPSKPAVAAPTTSTNWPSPPPMTTSNTDTGYGSDKYSTPHTTPWTITGADAYATVTTTLTMPTTTCVYAGVASEFPSWMSESYPGWYEKGGTVWPPRATNRRKRDEYPDDDNAAQYPFLVKIEERRLPGSPHPYCNQMQGLYNYGWGYANDANGVPITVQLTEQDPSYSAYVNAGEADKVRLRKRRTVPGECHCQWQSGQEP